MSKGSAKKAPKQVKGKRLEHDDKDDAVLSGIQPSVGVADTVQSPIWRNAIIFGVVAIVVGLILIRIGEQQASVASPKASRTSTKPQVTVPNTKMSIAEIKRRSKNLPCKDRHDSDTCAAMAKRGDCDEAPGWMTVMCAASCNRCELLDPKKRCSEENMNITLVNAYKEGDLNRMFESIAERTSSDIQILSRSPWMVLVRNFITEKESSTLLDLTIANLKRSTDQGSIAEDGFQEQVVSQFRTSSNSWCTHECEENPVVKGLMQRISDLIKVPVANFEAFQVLRYELTQKYDTHHDASMNDFHMAAGPRILTFFMYLSDVEDGGETHFPKLNISVKPEKGSALLWPSVENDYPDTQIDQRTYHAALPVKAGTKYAANSWIHLRNYKVPNIWGCTGSFDGI